MATTAAELFRRAAVILNDDEFTRWTLPELLDWLNEGQRAIVLAKPSANPVSVALSLQEGTLQALPAAAEAADPVYTALLRIVRNLKSSSPPREGGRTIRPTTRDLLDVAVPDWHDRTVIPYQKVVHQYVYDEANPREFYVIPGNDGDGLVEAVLAKEPAKLTVTGDDTDIANYEALTIELADVYTGPLLDWLCYRCYSKDETYAANGARASMHYAAFANAIGLKVQVETDTSPNARAGVTAT